MVAYNNNLNSLKIVRKNLNLPILYQINKSFINSSNKNLKDSYQGYFNHRVCFEHRKLKFFDFNIFLSYASFFSATKVEKTFFTFLPSEIFSSGLGELVLHLYHCTCLITTFNLFFHYLGVIALKMRTFCQFVSDKSEPLQTRLSKKY